MVVKKISFVISFILLTISLPNLSKSLSTTTYIFKGCSVQKSQNSLTLNTLLQSLSTQSFYSNFNRTVYGDVSGFFQCREDVSQPECGNCVKKGCEMVGKKCPGSVAARVQFSGCYVGYESSGIGDFSSTQFLYKVCESRQANDLEFGTLLGSALKEIVKGVNGTGYYAGDYQRVYVLGQCEGDLGKEECVDCVKSAVDKAKNECGSSVSGQIYLQKCYINYKYYPNGVTAESGSSGGNDTQKIIAIVVGAVAGFGLLVAVLLFLKSALKKKNTKY